VEEKATKHSYHLFVGVDIAVRAFTAASLDSAVTRRPSPLCAVAHLLT